MIIFFQTILLGKPSYSEFQTVWIQVRPDILIDILDDILDDILLDLIWIQTVCKDYELM